MYTIKLVSEDDIEHLALCMSRAFTAADPEKPWDIEHSGAYLTYWLSKQPDLFFGAYDEHDIPVGAIAANIKPWRTGVRCSDGVIFVDPDHQRQNIALMLSRKLLQVAMEQYNATSVEAVTFAGDTQLLAWYANYGMTPDKHAVLIKGKCADILSRIS